MDSKSKQMNLDSTLLKALYL